MGEDLMQNDQDLGKTQIGGFDSIKSLPIWGSPKLKTTG